MVLRHLAVTAESHADRCSSHLFPTACRAGTGLVFSFGLAFILGCGGASGASPTVTSPPSAGQFTEINLPAGAVAITARAVNANGDIAGDFRDGNGVKHGFLRTSSGAMTFFDAPGAGTSTNQGTGAEDINSSDSIVGQVVDQANIAHSYIRSAGGSFTVFDVAGAQQTEAVAMNDSGAVTGDYSDALGLHGFVRDATGGLVTFDAPLPTTFAAGPDTVPAAINSAGMVVGSDNGRGFVRNADGSIAVFDASGVGDGTTAATNVNDNGLIVGALSVPADCVPTDFGTCFPGPGGPFSFMGQGSGFTVFNPAGPGTSSAAAVNAGGEVVGTYIDGKGIRHGYIRNPDHSLVIFDEPNAAQMPLHGTIPTDINAGGEVVGFYLDAAGTTHAFSMQ